VNCPANTTLNLKTWYCYHFLLWQFRHNQNFAIFYRFWILLTNLPSKIENVKRWKCFKGTLDGKPYVNFINSRNEFGLGDFE